MKKMNVNLVTLCLIALGALSIAAGPTRANAQAPGPHPHYMKCVANMRAARAVLQGNFANPAHAQAAREVTDEIDHAINDLKYALKVEGRDSDAPVPPNTDIPPTGRLQAALDYLSKAYADASGPESDPAAYKSQAAALQRIDRSRNVLKFALTGH